MARLFTDGAEHGQVLGFWDQVNTMGGSPSISSLYMRSGNYSYQIDGWAVKNFTSVSELYYRCAVMRAFNSGQIHSFMDGDTNVVQIMIDSDDKVKIYNGNTLVATGNTVLYKNRWYVVEVHIVTGASGLVEVRLDGVMEVSYSGNINASTVVNKLYVTRSIDRTFLDDIALNDVSGSSDNTWCGDGHVIALLPNGNGDTNQWSASSGLNYQCVDEGFFGNGDTDYVSTSTSGQVDLYNIQDPSLPSGAVIKRVWATCVAKKTVSENATITVGLKTGATEYWGSAQQLETDYKAFSGQVYSQNPNTLSAWTISDLTNLQIGVKS